MSQTHLDFLDSLLRQVKNQVLTLTQIKKQFDETFHYGIHEYSIDVLRRGLIKLDYSYKRTKKQIFHRNSPRTLFLRHQLVFDISRHLMINREFIYIDESCFKPDMIPYYSWAKKGESNSIEFLPKQKGITLLAAISKRGIVGLQLFQGSVKGADFGSFVLNLIKVNQLIEKGLNNFVFFWDNARIHSAKVNKKILKNIIYCPNAPYSPFLNPIEQSFSTWKRYFSVINFLDPNNTVSNILSVSGKITTKKIYGYIIDSFEYLKLSIRNVPIR